MGGRHSNGSYSSLGVLLNFIRVVCGGRLLRKAEAEIGCLPSWRFVYSYWTLIPLLSLICARDPTPLIYTDKVNPGMRRCLVGKRSSYGFFCLFFNTLPVFHLLFSPNREHKHKGRRAVFGEVRGWGMEERGQLQAVIKKTVSPSPFTLLVQRTISWHCATASDMLVGPCQSRCRRMRQTPSTCSSEARETDVKACCSAAA